MNEFRAPNPVHPGHEKPVGAEWHDVAIVSRGVAGSEEPTLDAGRTSRRFLTIWGGNILMTIVVVAAVMGLTRFADYVTRQAQKVAPADRPGAGIIVRSEVLRLWLPRTLTELANRQSQSPVIRTHEELQRFLEVPDQKDLWYGLTARTYQVNGDFLDLTFIRRPYNDPAHFPELLAILAKGAGSPPRDRTTDFSTASVHVLAEDLSKREPREVMAELLGHPCPTADQERSP